MATRRVTLRGLLNQASGGRQVTNAGDGLLSGAIALEQTADAMRRQRILQRKG